MLQPVYISVHGHWKISQAWEYSKEQRERVFSRILKLKKVFRKNQVMGTAICFYNDNKEHGLRGQIGSKDLLLLFSIYVIIKCSTPWLVCISIGTKRNKIPTVWRVWTISWWDSWKFWSGIQLAFWTWLAVFKYL